VAAVIGLADADDPNRWLEQRVDRWCEGNRVERWCRRVRASGFVRLEQDVITAVEVERGRHLVVVGFERVRTRRQARSERRVCLDHGAEVVDEGADFSQGTEEPDVLARLDVRGCPTGRPLTRLVERHDEVGSLANSQQLLAREAIARSHVRVVVARLQRQGHAPRGVPPKEHLSFLRACPIHLVDRPWSGCSAGRPDDQDGWCRRSRGLRSCNRGSLVGRPLR
jgi:hypothetical protein